MSDKTLPAGLLIVLSLFGGLIFTGEAPQPLITVTEQSSSYIIHPQPTPENTSNTKTEINPPMPYTGTNYAPMFQNDANGIPYSQSLCHWGDYHIFGDVCFGNPNIYPQITHRDTTVLGPSGKASIRIDGPGNSFNGAREVNGYQVTVKPGDHVVMTMWIKANNSSVGAGGIFGFDVVGSGGDNILEVTPRVPQDEVWTLPISLRVGNPVYVPYNSDWTQLICDVTIPYTVYTHEDNGQALSHGPQTIIALNPLFGASWNLGESAAVWFADAEIFVNPETALTAYPAPTTSNNPITVGDSVTLTGTVAGQTGSITFFTKLASATSWIQLGAAKTLYSGVAASDPYTPTTSGQYQCKFEYHAGSGTSGSSNTAALTVNTPQGPVDPPPQQKYTVNIANSNGGYSTPSGTQQYLVGQSATITAHPNEGYVFDKWLLNGVYLSGGLTVSISGSVNVTYNLQPEYVVYVPPTPTPTTWSLVTAKSGLGEGTVSPASGLVASLSQVVQAIAAAGSIFVGWLFDSVTTYTDNPHTITAAFGESHTITAQFNRVTTPTPSTGDANWQTLFDDILGEFENTDFGDVEEIIDNLA
jgi:hypothetical protein